MSSNPMNAAQRRALRRSRGTQQNAAPAEVSLSEAGVRKRLFLSRREWFILLLGAAIGGVLSLFADILCRPLIAAMLSAPRVKVIVYRWNPEVSGLPCTRYSLSVEPQRSEEVEAINLGIEFPKTVKSYALAGTWRTVGGTQVMGGAVVRSGPDGCYFDVGTEINAIPPNIATTMIPAPDNKFLLVATDIREPIEGKFIVPENPGQKEVRISGDYRYTRVGVPMKKAFDILIKTVTVN